MNTTNLSFNDNDNDNDNSWADIFENEKGDSINDILPNGKVAEQSNILLDRNIQSNLDSAKYDDDNDLEYNKSSYKIYDSLDNVNNIMKIKLTKISDIKILYNEVCVISYLKKYIDKNNKIINKIIIENLEWLFNTSLYLSKKLKLGTYNHKKNNDKNIIHRSSYLFCRHNYECSYNYNPRKHGCFAQHFVHNMVCVDITALIEYLKVNNLTTNNIKEIKKSICTISYVIGHMYDELKNGLRYKLYSSKNIHVNNIKLKQRRKNNKHKNYNTKNYNIDRNYNVDRYW